MAVKKVTDLTALTSVADDDLFMVVDVSDTTDSDDGTSKKITMDNLRADEFITISGGFYQNNTNFAYFPLSSASTTESSSLNYLTIAPVMANCRLVDVSIWAQSGSARNESINVYKKNSQQGSLGSVTASVSAGNVTTFTFNTSTYDFAQGDELNIGWTPNTAPNGVSFIVRLKLT